MKHIRFDAVFIRIEKLKNFFSNKEISYQIESILLYIYKYCT